MHGMPGCCATHRNPNLQSSYKQNIQRMLTFMHCINIHKAINIHQTDI